MVSKRDELLVAMIKESDKVSFEGRFERSKFLFDVLGEEYAPFPVIVSRYFEEAKLCFYQGAFAASILMALATFEELFRQLYRNVNEMEKANARGLAKLVGFALEDGFISLEEKNSMDELRELRNRLTHINVRFKKNDAKKKGTLLDFMLLWGDPRKEGLPIEELSKVAKRILAILVPRLCHRFFP